MLPFEGCNGPGSATAGNAGGGELIELKGLSIPARSERGDDRDGEILRSFFTSVIDF